MFKFVKRSLLLGLLSSGLLLAPAYAADAGRALFVFGDVKLEPAQGRAVSLKKNAELEVGDTIVTGANGRAQLLLNDNTKIALQPDTRFLIEAFNYAPAGSADVVVAANQAQFELLKGGFRSITGKAAKSNPEGFEVKTAVAVIGIRGTDFLGRLCDDSNCGQGVDPGLYLGVNSGAIFTRVNGQEYDVYDDRFGFTNGTGFSHRQSLPRGILDSGLGTSPTTSGKTTNRFISIASDPRVASTPVTHNTPSSNIGGNVEDPAGHEGDGDQTAP